MSVGVSSLQWGRGCSPRKVAKLLVGGVYRRIASMGPRLFTAEGRGDTFSALGAHPASMGPRLFTAEGEAPRGRRDESRPGFNGAAVVHRGRFHVRAVQRLAPLGASMGPRLFTAEGLQGSGAASKHKIASMGPRLFTAEGQP